MLVNQNNICANLGHLIGDGSLVTREINRDFLASSILRESTIVQYPKNSAIRSVFWDEPNYRIYVLIGSHRACDSDVGIFVDSVRENGEFQKGSDAFSFALLFINLFLIVFHSIFSHFSSMLEDIYTLISRFHALRLTYLSPWESPPNHPSDFSQKVEITAHSGSRHRPSNWKPFPTDRMAFDTRYRLFEPILMIDSDSISDISVVYLLSQSEPLPITIITIRIFTVWSFPKGSQIFRR
jgi:hypothetical protein